MSEPETFTIKPFKWNYEERGRRWTQDTIYGLYIAYQAGRWCLIGRGGTQVHDLRNVDEAKEEAEKDYRQQLIEDALESSPQRPEPMFKAGDVVMNVAAKREAMANGFQTMPKARLIESVEWVEHPGWWQLTFDHEGPIGLYDRAKQEAYELVPGPKEIR